MNPGEVLVLDCDTMFSNYIRRFTGSPWTHVALMGRDGLMMDYCINGKQKNTLEQLLYEPCVQQSCIATPPPQVDIGKMLDEAEMRFNESRYDRFCILRLIPKMINQRDQQNLHYRKRIFTCSSLIARSAALATREGHQALPAYFHYSQTIPDDFAMYWRTRKP